MNDRKQHVIKKAHQLFINKGFQNTSIQDILEYSGIAKGTFYNYFPSKNDLLMAIFKSIYTKMEQERNELLVGQNPADIEIFIQQVELQLRVNRANKLLSLFEEVLVSNDKDLKEFFRNGQIRVLNWIYQRLTNLFGEDKKPYLLDCAIMFLGILNHNLKFNTLANESTSNLNQVVRYSVARLVKIVEEVSESGDQLMKPEQLEKWIPDFQANKGFFHQQLSSHVLAVKKEFKEQEKYHELLDFIHEELLHTKNPRKFLVESTLATLKSDQNLQKNKDIEQIEQLTKEYFSRQ